MLHSNPGERGGQFAACQLEWIAAQTMRPAQVPSTVGLITAVYGVGQIVGPPLAASLLARRPATGFSLSLELAAAALALGAALYLLLTRLYPLPAPAAN